MFVRVLISMEVFHVGYLTGRYRQGMDCMERLVSLRSALGGEMAAIIRERVGGWLGASVLAGWVQ